MRSQISVSCKQPRQQSPVIVYHLRARSRDIYVPRVCTKHYTGVLLTKRYASIIFIFLFINIPLWKYLVRNILNWLFRIFRNIEWEKKQINYLCSRLKYLDNNNYEPRIKHHLCKTVVKMSSVFVFILNELLRNLALLHKAIHLLTNSTM